MSNLLNDFTYSILYVNLPFFFQVMLHSQVKASLTIYDAWLDLQDGFTHSGQGDGRPASGFFPLVISPTSRAGMLFSICLVIGIDEGMPFSSLALCIVSVIYSAIHSRVCI